MSFEVLERKLKTKKMKNNLKVLKLLMCCTLIALSVSCTKSGKMEFSNLSGKDFYGCQIWFSDSENGNLIGYEEAGNVMMGESGKVKMLGAYCYVYAKDASGRMVMTKTKKAFDGMTFYRSDLY